MHAVELLNRVVTSWAAWVAAGLLESAILLGVVALVLLAAGKRLPAFAAHVALLLVLVKALLPIGIPVPRPDLSAWFVQADEPLAPTGERETVPSAPAAHAPQDAIKPIATTDVAPTTARTIAGSLPAGTDTAIATFTTVPAANRVPLSWQSYTLLAWLAVSVALIVRLVLLHWRLCRALGRSFDSATESLETLVQELAGRLAVRRKIAVAIGPADISPAIAGCWRPTLIIPRGLESRLSREQLEWVLMHELSHVRRGDLACLLLQRLVESVCWFNPVVWLAGRWAEHYRECACDELALEHVSCDRAQCGAAFVALLAGDSTRPSLAMSFRSQSRLTKHRLRRLVDDVSARHVLGKRLSAALVAGVCVLATLSLSERRVAAENSAVASANASTEQPNPDRVERQKPPADSSTPRSLAEAQPLVDRLQQQQNAQIRSARMRVKVLYLSKAKDSPIQQGHELADRANHHLEWLLDRTDFSRPDCLRKLRDALVEGNLIVDQPAYHTLELVWRRSNPRDTRYRITRDDQVVATHDNQATVEYVPRRREAFIQHSPRTTGDPGLGRLQYSLWHAGPMSFASVLRQDARKPHPTALVRGRDGSMQLAVTGMPLRSAAEDAPGNWEVQHFALQLTADERIVRLDTTDASHSNPIRELDFQQYPGGIVFPRVRISQYYRDPMTLEDITVTILEHAEFNVDIPDREFRMAVPANTAVWDRRDELKLRAAEMATDDVLTLFER